MVRLFKKIKQKTAAIAGPFKILLRWVLKPKSYAVPFIPLKWLSRYTMNGKVRIQYLYSNDFCPSGKPRVYKKEQIDLFIDKIKDKGTFYYGEMDLYLYQALEKFSIKDKETAIMGSQTPIYESMCIFYGGKPTTIEYNKITSEDSRLKTITVDEYNKFPKKFDAAFSISSFEHDGLGRYGDPLNPDGDILAMTKMKSILKPGGILFLAVPVGRDTLVWNVHRIYGRNRLPLLLKDWELIDVFGFSDCIFNYSSCDKQPIFILRNNRTNE